MNKIEILAEFLDHLPASVFAAIIHQDDFVLRTEGWQHLDQPFNKIGQSVLAIVDGNYD